MRRPSLGEAAGGVTRADVRGGGPTMPMRSSRRAALVMAGLLWAVPGALAQTGSPRGEIAAGAMFEQTVGRDCDLDGVMLADCLPLSTAWWISPAYHITERVALVGEVSRRSFDLKTSATLADQPLLPLDLPSLAVDVATSTYAFGGGLRVTGTRAGRVTPFVQTVFSYARINGSTAVLFLRESFASSGLLIEPSAGADIHLGERIAIRILGGYGAGFSEGEVNHAVRVGAGVVFGFANR